MAAIAKRIGSDPMLGGISNRMDILSLEKLGRSDKRRMRHRNSGGALREHGSRTYIRVKADFYVVLCGIS